MTTRRTTLSASSDALATLEAEARRRKISLAKILREVVEREAADIRARRRPRIGIISDGGGLAQASVDDEESPITAHERG